MGYSHIVFDIDGTLIDSEYALMRSFHKTIAMVTGRRLSIPEMKFILGIPGRKALEQLGITDVDATLAFWEVCLGDYFYTEKVYPGVREFLPFGLENYFAQVVCADDTRKHKPDPEPLLYYMEACKVRNDEVLYIGDSIYDMQCAATAGVDRVLALWGSQESRHIDATYVASMPDEIRNQLILRSV